MVSGPSVSDSQSYQSAYQNIAQSYSGTCNFSCSNNLTDINVVAEGTTITGGIKIEQQCNVDGSCILQNTTDATASIMEAASNSAGASEAGSWLTGFNFGDYASALSYQDMRQLMNQNVTQSCGFSSSNDMKDVVVFASDSQISGGILISQTGDAGGACTLNDMMQATAAATAQATNDAQSGKKAKSGSQWIGIVAAMVGVVIVIVVVVGVLRYFVCKGKDAHKNHPTLCGKAPPIKRKKRQRSPAGRAPSAASDEGKIVQNFVFGDEKIAEKVISNLGYGVQQLIEKQPLSKQQKIDKARKDKINSKIELDQFYPNFKGSEIATII